MKSQSFYKPTKEDLKDILIKPAMASTEVLIYEVGDMSDYVSKKESENIRSEFVKTKVKIKQITNNPEVASFTEEHTDFPSQSMQFRFVPSSVYNISRETVIFDDTVAIYSLDEMLIIEDAEFAESQRQLFMSIWDQGISPKLNFEYKPNHSYFRNIDCIVNGKQVIVWPELEATIAYKGFTEDDVQNYVESIINKDPYYDDASYMVAFMWSMDGSKMLDIWKMMDNSVDDRSGPLTEAKVYQDGLETKEIGLASGTTLLVLGYEEKLRRQSRDLKGYLQGPPPNLPLEVYNGKIFFDYN